MVRRIALSWSLAGALLVTLAIPAYSQGAAGVAAVAGTVDEASEDGVAQRSVAANNEWIVGTQIGILLFGEGDFADNLLATGMLRYEIPLAPAKSLRLPIFSNLGEVAAKSLEGSKADSLKSAVSAILSTGQGLNVGIHPYRVFTEPSWGGDLRVTAFGQVIGKVNTLKGRASRNAPDTAAKVDHTLLQGRGAVGVELAIGTPGTENKARRPLTMSLTGVATGFSARTYELVFGERRSWLPSLEFTAVVPIRDGAGVLVEGIGAPGHRVAWRMGMLLAASNTEN